MLMKRDTKVKEIRDFLELSQEEFAVILDVTKLTINRYENDYNINPNEEVKKKFNLLYNTLNKKEDTEFVLDLFKSNPKLTATAILSSLLQLGSSIFSHQLIEVYNYGVIDIINSPVGKVMLKNMKNVCKKE